MRRKPHTLINLVVTPRHLSRLQSNEILREYFETPQQEIVVRLHWALTHGDAVALAAALSSAPGNATHAVGSPLLLDQTKLTDPDVQAAIDKNEEMSEETRRNRETWERAPGIFAATEHLAPNAEGPRPNARPRSKFRYWLQGWKNVIAAKLLMSNSPQDPAHKTQDTPR